MVVVGAHFLLRCLDLERFVLHVVKVIDIIQLRQSYASIVRVFVPRTNVMYLNANVLKSCIGTVCLTIEENCDHLFTIGVSVTCVVHLSH